MVTLNELLATWAARDERYAVRRTRRQFQYLSDEEWVAIFAWRISEARELKAGSQVAVGAIKAWRPPRARR